VGPTCQREGGCKGVRAGTVDRWGRPVSREGKRATHERARGRWAAWAEQGTDARERGRKGCLPDPAEPRGDFSFFFFYFYFF
jgi:hypothetical protein